MTQINMGWDGDVWRLAVDGHAGYDDTGRDIVCSAMSMLCCALGAALEDQPGVVDLAIERAPGRYHLTLWVDEKDQAARGMIRMAEMGLGMVAQAYPLHVKIVSLGV